MLGFGLGLDRVKSPGEFNPLTGLDGNLAFWGKQSYVVTSSPDIDEWTDESAAGNDATQGTASDKPHETADIINGFSVARFDGSNDFLDSGNTFEAECRDQLGYGMVMQMQDGQPAATEICVGSINASSQDRGVFCFVNTSGLITIFYESNDNLARWLANVALPNGATTFGIVIWIDKTGGFIKVGKAVGGTFTELADDGIDDGDLSAVTPGDFNITDNPYWGARNNAGTDGFHAQIDLAEGFIQGGMTQDDFDNWGQRFLDVYDL